MLQELCVRAGISISCHASAQESSEVHVQVRVNLLRAPGVGTRRVCKWTEWETAPFPDEPVGAK